MEPFQHISIHDLATICCRCCFFTVIYQGNKYSTAKKKKHKHTHTHTILNPNVARSPGKTKYAKHPGGVWTIVRTLRVDMFSRMAKIKENMQIKIRKQTNH